MPTSPVINGYSWNYTTSGTNATIGTGTTTNGNGTTSGTSVGSTGTVGVVTIPSLIDGYTVTGIGQYAFRSCTNITTLTIPDTVTSIAGFRCFTSCANLTNLNIGISVTSIGDQAFNNCPKLVNFKIPDLLTTIGASSFASCTTLNTVIIPGLVTTIGASAFSGCTSLSLLTIPDSVATIGADAFATTSASLIVTINDNRVISTTTFRSPNNVGLFFFGNYGAKLALPPLTMTITSTANGLPLANGSTTKDMPIVLTFTSNKATSDFLAGDITINRGTLQPALTAISQTVYTIIFTPDIQGLYTINVAANKFTSSGQNNIASNTFTFTFDAAPTMTITSTIASGSASNLASIPLTFTASEAIFDFSNNDISFNKGTITNFAGSGSVYNATFTQAGEGQHTIYVPVGVYIDVSGNSNTAQSSFNWTYDSVKPTIEITSATVVTGSRTSNSTINLTFTTSKPATGFTKDDITFTNNGTLPSSLTTISPTVYTIIFTPAGQGLCTIDVSANKFTDAAGNGNTAATQFTWTFDTVSPSMTITSTTPGVTTGSTTNNPIIALTFTSSESIFGFAIEDITVTNGTLSPSLTVISPTVYTATFTPNIPTIPGPVACTIGVAANKFTDAAGNSNTAATTFNWTFDSISPGMTITSPTVTAGTTTKNESIELVFTSSASTANFVKDDIAVTNGTLGTFAGSGAVYTAIFTPTSPGLCTIDVVKNVFNYAAGNSNNAATTFNFTFDNVSPGMTITSTTAGVTSGSTTSNASIALTFTSTKATNNFDVGDITVTNGILSPSLTTISPTVYKAIFTPAGEGACTIDVAAGAYTDADGNSNSAATRFNWTFDGGSAGMTITSTTLGVTTGSATNNATIELTFTSTEPTNNFDVGDITVTNGELSNFAGSGAVYTATFTPTSPGGCTIDVAAGSFTDAGGNGNIAATTFNWTFDDVDYENVTPTGLSFVNNKLAVLNRIDSADVDRVSFVVNAGSLLYSLEVTSLLNANNISYVLDISGGSTVSSGSFTQAGANLLNGAFLEHATNTTYILTLTCVGTNAYSIVGRSLATGYTLANRFSVGYIPNYAAFNDANNLEQTYITGFLDVSGAVIQRNGDLRVMDGKLIVREGDVSLNNGNLYVSGNASVNSNVAIAGITTLTTIVSRDNMDVSGASTLGGSLTVAGITSLTNHVGIANNKQFTVEGGKSIFGGDVSLNSNIIVDNGVSLKSTVDVIGSAVFANTVVNGTLLFNTRPSFSSDISLNGPNIDICGNLYAQYPANSIPTSAIEGGVGNIIDVDVSMNAGLSVAGATTLSAVATSGNAIVGGTLNIIGEATMSTLSTSNATTIGGPLNVVGKTAFLNDVSFNGSRIDICGNLYAQYPENSIPWYAITIDGPPTYNTDVSMNAGMFVSNAVTLGSTLVVSGKTAFRGDISLGTVNGSRIDICGNLYANYAPNSIQQSSIIGGVGNLFNTDVSMNAGLYVKDSIKLDTITLQYQETPVAGLYVNAALNATTFSSSGNATVNSTLTVTGATALSSTLNVTGSAALGGALTVTGATTTAALTTTGAATFNGTLNVSEWSPFNAAVAGRSTLAVVGATTLKSTLTVATATRMNSGLSVVGATTMNTTLNGVGATTLAAVNAINILNVSGATTIGSTLAVAGATTLASLLTVVGTSRFKGDCTMSSTLNVLGDVSLNSTLNVTAATTLAALTVERSTTMATTLRVNQHALFGLDVITSNTLTVAGDVSMNTRLLVGGATSFRSTLAVTEATTLAAITTTGNAMIGDGLVVSGATTFSQDASLNVTSVDISGVVNARQVTIGETTLQFRPTFFQLGGDIDGEIADDRSGISVSLSADGSILAIGATQNDGTTGTPNDVRGHVRVYQRDATNTTIVPIGWKKLGGDIDGEVAGDQSGQSVEVVRDLSSNIIVAIGANLNDGTTANGGDNRGHVRVYQYEENKVANTNQGSDQFGPLGWKRLGADIDGEVALDQSGYSLSLAVDPSSNIIVAIGSNLNDGTTTSPTDNRGKVRVYQYEQGKAADTNQSNPTFGPLGWKRLGADIDGEVALDESGWSVALSGDGSTVAIGGYKNDGTTTSANDNRGHVRVYKYGLVQANTWSQLGTDIDGEAAGDQSGFSVSLSGDGTIVAIGANLNDGTTTSTGDNRGHVRVYKYGLVQPNAWSQLGGDIDGEATLDQSGYSVFLSADGYTVAIGAQLNDGTTTSTGDRGHVRVYKYDPLKISAVTNQSLSNFGPAGWTRLGVDIDGELPGDQSGISVSLSADGSTVAIGANLNDGTNPGAATDNRGHVRVYSLLPSAGLLIDASLNAHSIVTAGYASVGGNLNVTGATTISKTLYVNGASIFSTLSSVNATSIVGTLNVNGATAVSSTLQINGAATASSLTTNSNATVVGALNVAASTTMGSLNFTGQLLQW